MNKSGYLKDSTQTSLNFAHEEHEGSLELSTVVSTILEEDILLWKTSHFAIHLISAWCSAILTTDRWKSGNEKNLDTSLSRFSMCLGIGRGASTAYTGKFLEASPGSKQGIFDPRLECSVFIVMNVSYVYINLNSQIYHVLSTPCCVSLAVFDFSSF